MFDYSLEDAEYLERFELEQLAEGNPSPLDGMVWPDDISGAARPPGRAEDGRGAAGLSKPHISPHVHRHEPHPTIDYYLDGGMVVYHSDQQVDPGARGERGLIRGFSQGSRMRMQRQLARTRRASVPLFVTFTYPDEYPTEPSRWSRDMDALGKRMQRKGWGCFWRKEFQTRKSGENVGHIAPHYHAFVWGATFAELFLWARGAWYEIVGSGDERHLRAGVRVEVLRDARGARGYVSKYLGKVDEDDLSEAFPDGVGRMWGIVNRSSVPWSYMVKVDVTHEGANKLLRLMRRYMRRDRVSTLSNHMLCNAPEFWFDRYEEMLT